MGTLTIGLAKARPVATRPSLFSSDFQPRTRLATGEAVSYFPRAARPDGIEWAMTGEYAYERSGNVHLAEYDDASGAKRWLTRTGKPVRPPSARSRGEARLEVRFTDGTVR